MTENITSESALDAINRILIEQGSRTWEQLADEHIKDACISAARALALLEHRHNATVAIIEEAGETVSGGSDLERIAEMLQQLTGQIAEKIGD